MSTLPIYQVDAFADQLFKGNPAAVIPLESWLPDETLQSIALENNLSETAFFIPSGDNFHLRWFTPTVEVNLCGHATLAASHVLFEHLAYSKDTIRFDSRSGWLSVEKRDGLYFLNFPADNNEAVAAPPQIEEALGITPLEVFRGKDDFMVIVDNQATIEALTPNFHLLQQLPARGLIVTAPGEQVDFVSRCFFPQTGVDEDPVTGSAHTTMTPYWAQKLNKKELTARQLSFRGGTVQCQLLGDRVALGGKAVTYLTGSIAI